MVKRWIVNIDRQMEDYWLNRIVEFHLAQAMTPGGDFRAEQKELGIYKKQ